MATVDIILKNKIEGLGLEADMVTVKTGYARNYLIPTGRAIEATKGNRKFRDSLMKKRASREADELDLAQKIAARLRKLRLSMVLKTGQGGRAFGSITTQDLARAITEQGRGLEIDRHAIQLDSPIKQNGRFDIPVKLHPEVTVKLKVSVVPPEDPAGDGSSA